LRARASTAAAASSLCTTPGAAKIAPTPDATAAGTAAKGVLCVTALERMKNLSAASAALGMVKIDCRNYGQKAGIAAKSIMQCTIKRHEILSPGSRQNTRISHITNVH
jgi:hypothetical protein